MHDMNTKAPNLSFGQNLRIARKQKGYTLARLSEISGISKRMIGHYETQVKRPSVDKIKMLANALEVSIDELMGSIDKTKNSKKNNDQPSYRIMKKVRIIERLTIREQKAIFQFINTIVEKKKLKEQLQERKKK
jgi:transcriptional regulator with XRE-family HTH domain